MKIEIKGKISAGYYNAMEASPCFYLNEEEVIDDLILEKLSDLGYDSNFAYDPCESATDVKNPLIGKMCRVIIEIEDAPQNNKEELTEQHTTSKGSN